MKGLFRLLLQPVSLLLLGIVITSCGIVMELCTGKPLFLVAIVAGSCLIAGSIAYNAGRGQKTYWR